MQNKKIRNFVISLIFFLTYILSKNTYVSATIYDQIEGFNLKMDNVKQFENIGNIILGYVQVIGTIAAVGALMIIGIRYMLGSAEDKSEKKETLIFYIIGVILVLAITNILPIIYNLAVNIFEV